MVQFHSFLQDVYQGEYMKFKVISQLICVSALSILSTASFATKWEDSAKVSGFARAFLTGEAIADASITVLETGLIIKTDSSGRFGPFYHPIGKPVTLELSKFGYMTTQSGTILIPPEGLTSPYDNITFQVPTTTVYYLLASMIGATLDEKSCHVTATITAYHKTLDDLPQGEENAVVYLQPSIQPATFYFDIFKEGPLKDKTYPFPTGITKTSADGGVAFFNVPPRPEPYHIIAIKEGVQFTEAQFLCRAGKFINVSPPRGPMALNQPPH
jgi:hypothetical protein